MIIVYTSEVSIAIFFYILLHVWGLIQGKLDFELDWSSQTSSNSLYDKFYCYVLNIGALV